MVTASLWAKEPEERKAETLPLKAKFVKAPFEAKLA